jgi:PHD/YefM family antitoxin component YafN of YafNO toxin-antitoxin module
MKLSENVKPISYLKTHASEVIHEIGENRNTYVITLNGEARVIVQDVREYEKTQESLALLKILAQSRKSMDEGRMKSAKKALDDVRKNIKGL